MKDKEVWDMLITRAKEVLNPRIISPFIEAGGVGAAILTKNGNVYTGVCIDTASTLGMCAERNAIANMITNGESKIDKLVCVMRNGEVGSPCGACREVMRELLDENTTVTLLNMNNDVKTLKVKDLLPYAFDEGDLNE